MCTLLYNHQCNNHHVLQPTISAAVLQACPVTPALFLPPFKTGKPGASSRARTGNQWWRIVVVVVILVVVVTDENGSRSFTGHVPA